MEKLNIHYSLTGNKTVTVEDLINLRAALPNALKSLAEAGISIYKIDYSINGVTYPGQVSLEDIEISELTISNGTTYDV